MRLPERNAQRRDVLMANDALADVLLQIGKRFLFVADGGKKNARSARGCIERRVTRLRQVGDRDDDHTFGQAVIDELISVSKRTVRSAGAIVTYENL